MSLKPATDVSSTDAGGRQVTASPASKTNAWHSAEVFGKKRTAAKGKILADEGYSMARRNGKRDLQHETYIVEVHPDDEPAFRSEVKAWVAFGAQPRVGDVVNVLYEPGTENVEIEIEGDPRFDWKLIAAKGRADNAAERAKLLDGPASQDPLS